MDIPNIMTIVNWGTSCSISTLWQRFGRCVRDQALEGEAILFTEKEHLDPERERKAERARTRKRAPHNSKTATSNKLRKVANIIKTEEVEVVGVDGSSSDEAEEVVAKRSGKSSKQLDPDVDRLINVDHRGSTCRRIPIMAAFQNDQAGRYSHLPFRLVPSDVFLVYLHLECDTGSPNGCPRCSPKPTRRCCDLHSPDAFSHLDVAIGKSTRQPSRSSLNSYTPNEMDEALRLELENWCLNQAEEQYGQAVVFSLGPGIIMGTNVRDRIVDCAHFNKIRTIPDLEKETKWELASEYGMAILDIIRKHYPPPPLPAPFVIDLANLPSSQPAHPRAGLPVPGSSTFRPGSALSNVSTSKCRGARCSLCQQPGHNCT